VSANCFRCLCPGAQEPGGTAETKNFIVLNELDNVRNKLYILKRVNGGWIRTPMAAPAFGTVGVGAMIPMNQMTIS